MLGKCANKSSKEWQDLLQSNNGNEQRTQEIWDLLFSNDADINTDPESDLEVEIFEDETVDEDLETPTFEQSLKKVKTYLKEQQYIIARKKVKNQKIKESRLKTINKQLTELEGVEAINAFVIHAYTEATETRKALNEAIKSNREGTIKPKDFLDILVAANEFANGYNILDEISKEDIDRYFQKPVSSSKPESEYTPQDKLQVAIQIREKLKIAFQEKAINLMAEILINYRNTRGTKGLQEGIKFHEDRIEKLKTDTTISDKARTRDINFETEKLNQYKQLVLDKDSLAELLKETSKNESVFDALLGPLISSGDAPLSLFAKMIKTQFEETKVDDILKRNEGVEKLQEFISKTGRGKSNVSDLYEGLFETLKVARRDIRGKVIRNSKQEIIFDNVISFVQKFDMNKYKDAELKFYEENPKPVLKENASDIEKKQHQEALKKYGILRSNWYKANTQAKSEEEIKRIVDEKKSELKKGIITNDEYSKWENSVIKNDRTLGKRFIGELSDPLFSKYKNEKWLSLYNVDGNPISPQGEFHKYLLDNYLSDQELLPVAQRKGYIVPSIEMDDIERLQRKGIKQSIKSKLSETVKRKKYDQELFGEQAGQDSDEDKNVYGIGTASGEKFDILPTYFTQIMDANDVSVDLLSSVLRFGSAARRYNALNEVQSEIYSFQKIIGNRTIADKDSKGNPILSSFAKKLGYETYIKDNGVNFSKFHVDEFINMVIKGEAQKSEAIANIELSKVTNTLISISAITTLSLDLLKGVANNLQGNIQLIIESAGKEFFSIGNYSKAKLKYYQKLGGAISDFNKPYAESWLGSLIDYYDAMQGTFKDEYGKDVTSTVAQKLFRTNTLFWNQHFGEHEVQVTAMLALMDATKVIDKENGNEISLLDAHEKYGTFLFDVVTDSEGNKSKKYKVQISVNKTLENPDGELVDFDEKQRINHTNILHALNKRMHGVYNEFDKSVLQKYSAGRLLLMYRKFLVPSIKRRYKKLGYDDELGSETEGFYRTFWNTFVRDIRTYKFNIIKQWTTYTPFQKAQIRKVIAEITIILALIALILGLTALAGDDDEDKFKNNYIYSFVLYEAVRLRSETKQFLPGLGIRDFYKVVKSPSAMTSTLDRSIKFFDQFVLTWDPDDLYYKRKTGIWDKGTNKSWVYFLKLMGYSGNNLNPYEATKSFEGVLNK